MASRTFKILVASAAVAAAELLPGERDLAAYTYEQYVAEFGKQANADHTASNQIFEANMKLIRQHNSDASKSWFATVNEFTDWTNEEFRSRRLGHKPHAFASLGLEAEYASLQAGLADIPERKDWRTDVPGSVTPPKNQGGCGSCWAFSATETLESHLALATGNAAPVLSPQQIVSCAPNPQQCGGSGGCAGSIQELAFNYTESAGITLEKDYPYQGVTGKCDTSRIKPVAKNSGFVQLPANNYTSLITAVATKGPIAISVAAGGIGWQLYGGGVYSGGLLGCGWDEDHAVQLVGYGVDGSKMYWLVRNSWGNWGEKGYIRIRRFGEGKEPCGIDKTPSDGDACKGDTKPRQLCGLCGILSGSSYPTGVQAVGDVSAVVV